MILVDIYLTLHQMDLKVNDIQDKCVLRYC